MWHPVLASVGTSMLYRRSTGIHVGKYTLTETIIQINLLNRINLPEVQDSGRTKFGTMQWVHIMAKPFMDLSWKKSGTLNPLSGELCHPNRAMVRPSRLRRPWPGPLLRFRQASLIPVAGEYSSFIQHQQSISCGIPTYSMCWFCLGLCYFSSWTLNLLREYLHLTLLAPNSNIF